MNPITVACTGAGYFSAFHYDAWSRIDGVKMVGSMARERLSAASKGLPAFTDLGAMLEQVHPDILDVITPPPTHCPFIETALANNVKTIICQKPFCNDLAEARQLVDACEQAGATLVIHENFRFQPWYRCIRKAIDSKLIGELHQITFRLRTGDGQGPDAYMDRQPYFQQMPRLLIHETGIHYIDTFRYLMGEPTAVYSDLRQMNPVISGEDAGYFIFDFDQGKRALFDGNRCLDHAAANRRTTLGECLVEGTQGTISLEGDGGVHCRAFGSTESSTLLAAQDWAGFAGDCVFNLQSHVVRSLRDNTALENTGREYLRNLDIESAIYESSATSRKIEL